MVIHLTNHVYRQFIQGMRTCGNFFSICSYMDTNFRHRHKATKSDFQTLRHLQKESSSSSSGSIFYIMYVMAEGGLGRLFNMQLLTCHIAQIVKWIDLPWQYPFNFSLFFVFHSSFNSIHRLFSKLTSITLAFQFIYLKDFNGKDCTGDQDVADHIDWPQSCAVASWLCQQEEDTWPKENAGLSLELRPDFINVWLNVTVKCSSRPHNKWITTSPA